MDAEWQADKLPVDAISIPVEHALPEDELENPAEALRELEQKWQELAIAFD